MRWNGKAIKPHPTNHSSARIDKENSNNNHRLHRRRPITNPEEGVGGGETIADNKNKIDAASATIGRFFLLFPESSFTASSLSLVARSFFYPVLFSDASRRLLIRQRIEGEARWHVDGNGKAFRRYFWLFARVVNQRRAGARNSSKIHSNSPAGAGLVKLGR